MTNHFYLIDFENVQPKALDRLKPGSCGIKVFLGQQQTRLLLELVQALQPFGADAEYIQIQGSGPDAVDFHIAFYIGRLSAAQPGATFDIISKDKGFDPLVKHLAKLGIGCRRLADIPGTAPAASAAATPARSAPPARTATPAKSAAAARPATPDRIATPAKARAKPAVAAKPRAAKTVAVTDPPAVRGPTAPRVAKAATATATTTRARTAEVVARLRKSSKPAKLSTLRSSITAWFKPALDDKAVDAVIDSLQASRQIVVAGSKVAYALD